MAPSLDPQFAVPLEKLRELFPDLEILDLLGAGGMGAVYRARQPRLDRTVALKVLTCPPELHDDFALRFEREAQVLARLNHPNIVTIYDFGEIDRSGDPDSHGNLFYFVMEFVNGADLNQMIRTGELKPEQALQIVPQICDALQYAHDEGVTHRDIKPANILVGEKGRVRIADFGLAKLIGADSDALGTGLTMTGSSMGTPHYMAPEQWETAAVVDHRADIYSLGVVFYEMLTGERPHGVFDPPSRKIEVDVKLDEVVLKAMEKDVDLRYQQASEIKEDVTRVTSPPPDGKRIAESSGTATGSRGAAEARSRVVTAAVLAVILLGATGYWFSPLNPFSGSDAGKDDGDGTENLDAAVAAPVAAPLLSYPSRLRATGTMPWTGQPVDLSAAFREGVDDFVDVYGSSNRWVALRADGTTVSSDGRADMTGISKLIHGIDDRMAMIDDNGKLVFPDGQTPEAIPSEIENQPIVAAAVGFDHGLSLTADGVALPWGLRYEDELGERSYTAGTETPQWPMPSKGILQDVVAVGAVATHAATVLKDGSLHVWGWEGVIELNRPEAMGNLVKIATINMDHFIFQDENDQLWRLQLPRGKEDRSYEGSSQFYRVGEGRLRSGRFYTADDGRWIMPRLVELGKIHQEMMDRNIPPEAIVVSGWGTGYQDPERGESWRGYAIWIEHMED